MRRQRQGRCWRCKLRGQLHAWYVDTNSLELAAWLCADCLAAARALKAAAVRTAREDIRRQLREVGSPGEG
jgi:hypothetical protein